MLITEAKQKLSYFLTDNISSYGSFKVKELGDSESHKTFVFKNDKLKINLYYNYLMQIVYRIEVKLKGYYVELKNSVAYDLESLNDLKPIFENCLNAYEKYNSNTLTLLKSVVA